MSKANDRLGWLAGLLVGLGAAAAVVVGGAVPRSSVAAEAPVEGGAGTLVDDAAVVILKATPTGELAVTPTEVRLGGLGPEAAAATFTVFNQTGRALAVGLAVVGDGGELAARLSARVTVFGESAYDGLLARLNGGVAPFPLEPGQEAEIRVDLTVPGSPCPGCVARVGLQFTTEPAGG